MKDYLKIVLGLIILVALSALIFSVINLPGKRTVVEPDYSDLMPVLPVVGPADNAYTYFSQAEKLVEYSHAQEDAMLNFKQGKSFETNKIEQLIADNFETFKSLDEGLKCSVCVCPEYNLNDDSRSSSISEQVKIMNLFLSKARYEQVMGRYSRAVSTCETFVKYINLRYRYSNSLVMYLVGLGHSETVFAQIERLIRCENVSLVDLRRLATVLESHNGFQDSLIVAAQSEFQAAFRYFEYFPNNAVDDMYPETEVNIPKSFMKLSMFQYMYSFDKSVAHLANIHRNTMINAVLPYAEMTLKKKMKEYSFRDAFLHSNFIGRLMCESISMANNTIYKQKCHKKMRLATLKLILALKLYRVQHGCFPEKLSLLEPEYVKLMPVDPFDGKAIKYDSQKVIEFECGNKHFKQSVVITGIVYSVGEDLIDQGGSTKTRTKPQAYWRRDGEDIVYGISEEIKTKRAEL